MSFDADFLAWAPESFMVFTGIEENNTVASWLVRADSPEHATELMRKNFPALPLTAHEPVPTLSVSDEIAPGIVIPVCDGFCFSVPRKIFSVIGADAPALDISKDIIVEYIGLLNGRPTVTTDLAAAIVNNDFDKILRYAVPKKVSLQSLVLVNTYFHKAISLTQYSLLVEAYKNHEYR